MRMAEILLAPGDIRAVDVTPPSQETASQLGALLLEAVDLLHSTRRLSFDQQWRVELYDSRRENREPLQYLAKLDEFYRSLLTGSVVDFSHARTWVMHGKYDNIPWHTDSPGDVRFMLNVGEDTSVQVAEEWDPELYWPGMPEGIAPTKATTIDLPTGATYAANGLVTDRRLLRPHQTQEQSDEATAQPNRIVLRTSLYAQDGWQARAVDGGVPVSLINPA